VARSRETRRITSKPRSTYIIISGTHSQPGAEVPPFPLLDRTPVGQWETAFPRYVRIVWLVWLRLTLRLALGLCRVWVGSTGARAALLPTYVPHA